MNEDGRSRIKMDFAFRTANLKKDFPDELVEKVKNNNTFLYGKAGTGKTHLLAAIVNGTHSGCMTNEFVHNNAGEEIRGAHHPTLVDFGELLIKLRGAYNKFGESEDSILEKVVCAKVLCLDDIGVDKPTDWNTSMLQNIINGRYKNGKRTHIASNFNLEEIAEMFGERIASRIAGMCMSIEMAGKDRRLENK